MLYVSSSVTVSFYMHTHNHSYTVDISHRHTYTHYIFIYVCMHTHKYVYVFLCLSIVSWSFELKATKLLFQCTQGDVFQGWDVTTPYTHSYQLGVHSTDVSLDTHTCWLPSCRLLHIHACIESLLYACMYIFRCLSYAWCLYIVNL